MCPRVVRRARASLEFFDPSVASEVSVLYLAAGRGRVRRNASLMAETFRFHRTHPPHPHAPEFTTPTHSWSHSHALVFAVDVAVLLGASSGTEKA